ncbi:MAG: hypothetical protein ACOCV2_02090, partial [Persicimonas sp.]
MKYARRVTDSPTPSPDMYEMRDNSGGAIDETTAWNPSDPTDPPCVIHRERGDQPGRVVTPHGHLTFLNVRGGLTRMAAQLGLRLRESIQQGAVPFFATYLERVLQKNSPLARLSNVLRWATHRGVTRRLRKNLPREFEDAARTMAEAADVNVDTLLKAYLMPESFLWLVGRYHGLIGTDRAPGLGAPPSFGCTSAVVRPPAAGTTLHGRNFDYFGVEQWDRNATVVFYHPDDGLD